MSAKRQNETESKQHKRLHVRVNKLINRMTKFTSVLTGYYGIFLACTDNVFDINIKVVG